MALTTDERSRVRHHLGYPNVAPAAAIQYGVVRPMQTLFLVESAMDKILPEAEDRVRQYLSLLDDIECKMAASVDYLVASAVEGVTLRPDAQDAMEREYVRWAQRLSDEIGAPLYALAPRFRTSLFGVNVPVRG